jgi:hypothetical protein
MRVPGGELPGQREKAVAALYGRVFTGVDSVVAEALGVEGPVLEPVRRFFTELSWGDTDQATTAKLASGLSMSRPAVWMYKTEIGNTSLRFVIREHLVDRGFVIPEFWLFDSRRTYYVKGLYGPAGFDAAANIKWQETGQFQSVQSEAELWTFAFPVRSGWHTGVQPLQASLITENYKLEVPLVYEEAGRPGTNV